MRTYRFICIVALAAILAACSTATTKHPVGTSGGPQTDTRLLGTWKANGPAPDDTTYIFFTRRSVENPDMEGVGVAAPHGEYGGSWVVASVIVGKVGERGFLNGRVLAHRDSTTERNNHFPVLYNIDDSGRLHLLPLDFDAAKAAVQAGVIAGTVSDYNVVITAGPAALDAYVAHHASTLFKPIPQFGTFRRVD